MNRDFKGIWVPREIWLFEDLSIQEKCLWAEIHSLYDRERGGCYASEEYLCEFIGVKRSRLYEMLKKLKDLRLMETVSFDGRNTLRRAVVPEDSAQESWTAAVRKTGHQESGKPDSCSTGSRTGNTLSPYYISNKDENKERGRKGAPTEMQHNVNYQATPSPHKKKKLEKTEKETIAFGKHVHLKPGEYEDLCKQLTKPIVDHYIAAIDDHVPNRREGPYTDYAAAVRQWHRRDKAKGSLPKINQSVIHQDELEVISDNRYWFREYMSKMQRPNRDENYSDNTEYVQFTNHERNNSSARIYFKDTHFQHLIKNEAAKRLYIPGK